MLPIVDLCVQHFRTDSGAPLRAPIPTRPHALTPYSESQFDRTFRGNIDDVRVFSGALSASEIAYDATHRAQPPVLPCKQFNVDMNLPALGPISGTVATPGGNVPFALNPALDRTGKIITGGPSTIGTSDVTLKGKTRFRNAALTYTIQAASADRSVKLKLIGTMPGTTADLTYTAPTGIIMLPGQTVAYSPGGTPVATVSMATSIDSHGHIKGTLLVRSAFVGGLRLSGRISGTLIGEALTLRLTAGPWSVIFKGTRNGAVYTGQIKIHIPPETSTFDPFDVPDLFGP